MIEFNSRSDFYSEFSNFAKFPIVINGKEYPTVEHYYQSQKFEHIKFAEHIRNAKTPSDAKRLGKSRIHTIKENWDQMREQVMYEALYAKFTQHERLKKMLIDTKDEVLVHVASWDDYWGTGKYNKGKNRLGELLMQIREELKK